MNVNSPIAKEVAEIQSIQNNHRSNMFLLKLLTSRVQRKFYQESSLYKYISKEMNSFHKDRSEDKQVDSFFIDLEAQFMMVPKKLAYQVIITKFLEFYEKTVRILRPYKMPDP